MSETIRFRAVIEDPGGGGAFVTIPFDVEKIFGKSRVKIVATIDGEPYRGTLVRMGGPCHLLLILKEIRAKIGKSFGDEVEVELAEDLAPRVVVMPQDFQEALEENPGKREVFERLSYTRQKEAVQWIEAAKREQTRRERVLAVIEQLKGKAS